MTICGVVVCAIHSATVRNSDDKHEHFSVPTLVDDAVVADSDMPQAMRADKGILGRIDVSGYVSRHDCDQPAATFHRVDHLAEIESDMAPQNVCQKIRIADDESVVTG